jgi:galactose oxidase
MPMVAVPAAAYVPVAPTLDRSGWTAMSPPGRPGRRARAAARKQAMKVLDGRERTAWRPAEPLPGTGRAGTLRLRRLTIDLHGPAMVSALRYTPGRKPLGRIGRYAIHVSFDGRTWQRVTHGRWANTSRTKTATFAAVPADRVRLSARPGAGHRVESAAEIELLGVPPAEPPPPPPPTESPTPEPPSPTPTTEGPPGFHPGLWSDPIGLPIVPGTAVLLPNDKVLTFSGVAANGFTTDTTNGGKTQISILDVGNGVHAGRREVAETGHEMFCTGLSILADGRVVINGGSGGSNTTVYDPLTDTFSTGPQMAIPRGYQTSATLSDGRVFALGGSWSGGETDKDGEVMTAAGTSWHRLPGVTADSILTPDWQGWPRQDNHAWLFSTSGGGVFHAGPSTQMNWFGTSGDGTTTPAGDRADAPVMMNGNAVMYDTGKILAVGGAPNYQEFADDSARWATPRAYTLDITAGFGQPVGVRRVGDMSQPRTFANSVVLPDGSVVVTGGQQRAKPFTDTEAVRAAEMWDPVTGLFTELATEAIPRTYHSFSLLLADGHVLAGGGGLCWTCETNHPDVEILTPPYLLRADGTLRIRPAITGGVPAEVAAGATLTVTTDKPVASFALVRVGTSTHSINSDQRRVALTPAPAGQNAYQVTIPADRGTTVPGPWLLFALDQHGTPSVGAWMRIP